MIKVAVEVVEREALATPEETPIQEDDRTIAEGFTTNPIAISMIPSSRFV
jgi:hypothetical protein